MSLYNEIKSVVRNSFGEFSAAKIDLFAKKIDPEKNPKEFIDICVDFLSTMLGEKAAKEKMKPFYDQYVK